ncbi:flagellar basal body P-ring formation chaperone FlgA [Rhizobium daejeonense]
MRFSRNYAVNLARSGAVSVLLFSAGMVPQTALAATRYAVVPTATIFPGEIIGAGRVTEVEVTNPNLAGGYATDVSDVIGKVSKRTLVPGRTIPVSSLREPFAVQRGSTMRMTVNTGGMTISAAGTPLQDAMVGDVVRMRNLDTGVIVSGTVMADGTVEVMQK